MALLHQVRLLHDCSYECHLWLNEPTVGCDRCHCQDYAATNEEKLLLGYSAPTYAISARDRLVWSPHQAEIVAYKVVTDLRPRPFRRAQRTPGKSRKRQEQGLVPSNRKPSDLLEPHFLNPICSKRQNKNTSADSGGVDPVSLPRYLQRALRHRD